MSLGINLHAVVRPIITSVHPDVTVTLYRSMGQDVDDEGAIKALYQAGEVIQAQVQSERADQLYHSNNVGQESVVRRVYLFSGPDLSGRVAGIIRPNARNGDFLHFANDIWALVTAIEEDFSENTGWMCVRVTMQVKAPKISG